MNDLSLNELRKEIDRVDAKLLPLLEKRMELSSAVAKYKLKNDLPIEDLDREAKVLEKAQTENPAIKPYVRSVYEEIIKASKEYQRTIH